MIFLHPFEDLYLFYQGLRPFLYRLRPVAQSHLDRFSVVTNRIICTINASFYGMDGHSPLLPRIRFLYHSGPAAVFVSPCEWFIFPCVCPPCLSTCLLLCPSADSVHRTSLLRPSAASVCCTRPSCSCLSAASVYRIRIPVCLQSSSVAPSDTSLRHTAASYPAASLCCAVPSCCPFPPIHLSKGNP